MIYDSDDRICRIEIDDTLMFRDAGHLTVDGSVLLGRRTDIGDRVLRLAR